MGGGAPSRRTRAIGAAVASGAVAVAVALALTGREAPPPPAAASCRPAPHPPAPGVSAARRYVAPDGDDSAPGTRQRPWRSLGKALAHLAGGDVLVLRAGIYRGNVELAVSGSAAAPTTLRSFPGERAVVAGRLKISARHAVVRGLVFDGNRDPAPPDVAVYVAGGDDVWLASSEVKNARKSGVFVGDGADRVFVVGNYIHHNGTHERLDHGIYWAQGEGGLIAQNVIADNLAFGIQLYPEADRVVVRENTIVSNGLSGIVVGGEGRRTSDDNRIVRNTVAFNGEQGLSTSWDGQVGLGNLAVDNVAYGNPSGGIGGRGLEARGTLEADPQLVSVRSADFRTRVGSAASSRGSRLDVACLLAGRGRGTVTG